MSNKSQNNRGKVKFFNETKGFGFITDDHSGEDVFVHATGVQKGIKLREGDTVLYNIGEGKKGPIANDVTRL